MTWQCPFAIPDLLEEHSPLEPIFGDLSSFILPPPLLAVSKQFHYYHVESHKQKTSVASDAQERAGVKKPEAAAHVRISCTQRRSSNSPFIGKSDWSFHKMGKSRKITLSGLRAHGIVRMEAEIVGCTHPQLYLSSFPKMTREAAPTLHLAYELPLSESDEDTFYLFVATRPRTDISHHLVLTLIDQHGNAYTQTLLSNLHAAGHKYASGQRVKARYELLKSTIVQWNRPEGFRLVPEETSHPKL